MTKCRIAFALASICAPPAAASTLTIIHDTATEASTTVLQAPVAVAGGRVIGQSSGGSDNGQVYLLTPAAAGAPYTKTAIHGWAYVSGNPITATDGAQPSGNLTPDAAGNLWGTTNADGANNTGTLFELKRPAQPSGAWTYRVAFSLPASLTAFQAGGYGNLVFDKAGNLFGLAKGAYQDTYSGVIFKVPGATLAGGTAPVTVVAGIPYDLSTPYSLVRDSNGNFFGLSASPTGTLWEAASGAGGTYTVTALHTFCSDKNAAGNCLDGETPTSIVVTPAGVVFGVTYSGGNDPGRGYPCYCSAGPDGLVFSLRPTAGGKWSFHVVHEFLWWNTDGSATTDIGVGRPIGLTLAGARLLATMTDGGSPAFGQNYVATYQGGVESVTGAGADAIVNNSFGSKFVNPMIAGPINPLFAPVVGAQGGIFGATAGSLDTAGNETTAGVIYKITQ